MSADYAHKWYAFIGIALLSFGCYLDYTIVNIALPTIQQNLNANLVTLQWVMNIYFLALCILATIMGRCGDLYGRRRVFYIGAIIFAVASFVAGFASTTTWLIFGRLLQGVGAAIVFPLGLSLVPASFPKHQQAKSIAWLGSLGGIALALGPVLGGFIVTYLSWRWIFFINIPLIIVGFLFSFNAIDESIYEQKNRTLDWLGMLLLALAMGGIVLGLIHGQTFGWGDHVTQLYLVTGIVAVIALIKIEHNQINPLIDLKDFIHPLFYSGAMLCFLTGVLSAAVLFFDPLYLQIVRGESPELSGLVLFAIPIAVFLVAFIVGWLIQELGIFNTIIFGLILAVMASFLHIFFTNATSIGYILISFIFLGSMWAFGNTVPVIAAQTAAGPHRASVATGTLVTMFNVGASIGLAIAVVIYDFMGNRYLQNMLSTPSLNQDKIIQLRQSIANPAQSLQISMSDIMHQLFNDAFMKGFSYVMWFSLILSIAILGSVVLARKGRH